MIMHSELEYANTLLDEKTTPYVILDRGKHDGKIAEVTEAAMYHGANYLQVKLIDGNRKFSFRIHLKCPKVYDHLPETDDELVDFLGQTLDVGDPVFIGRGDVQMLGRVTELLSGKVLVQPIIHRYKKTPRAWEAGYCLKVPEDMAVLKTLTDS